jgi:ribosomal small subunit protein bTHX
MGKGDKKSRKGKRWKGSFGVTRNRKSIKSRLKRAATKKPTAPAAAAAEAPAKPKRAVKKKNEG